PLSSSDSTWKYADIRYETERREAITQTLPLAMPTYYGVATFAWASTRDLTQRNPSTGRELMENVIFSKACAACHLLTFEKRFDKGVTQENPEVVHAFLQKKFSGYTASHQWEWREMKDPARSQTGKPLPPRLRTATATQWIQKKVTV